jgi:hypothetical protein
MVSRYSLSG